MSATCCPSACRLAGRAWERESQAVGNLCTSSSPCLASTAGHVLIQGQLCPPCLLYSACMESQQPIVDTIGMEWKQGVEEPRSQQLFM